MPATPSPGPPADAPRLEPHPDSRSPAMPITPATPRRSPIGLAAASMLVLALEASAGEATSRPIDFNREIRPILSNRCYACHGPDAGKRKGLSKPLRLDTEAGAFEDPGGYAAIVRGDPGERGLSRRGAADDPGGGMPPPNHSP